MAKNNSIATKDSEDTHSVLQKQIPSRCKSPSLPATYCVLSQASSLLLAAKELWMIAIAGGSFYFAFIKYPLKE